MAATQERDFYEDARRLILRTKSATLATAKAGVPHAALVTPAFTPELEPVLLLSELAIHTRQLGANPACALLLTGAADGPNPQTTPRLCLTGIAAKTADERFGRIFLAAHPYAERYAGFADFAFWRICLTESYYVGGFGAARKLLVAKLATAQ